MQVLHIHQTDTLVRAGGGVVVMRRVHDGLKRAGYSSRILTCLPGPEAADSSELRYSSTVRRLEKLIGKATSRLGFNDVHRIRSFQVKQDKLYNQSDILNIHGMQGNFSFLALPYLTAEKPAVLTLHDMWAFTGHCAYSYDCERWKTGCGRCPYPEASPPIGRDSTALEWKLKKWVYGRSRLGVITLSRAQTEQVRQSILGHLPIRRIPNGVDTEAYTPLDPEACRQVIGIPPGKKVLLFAAAKLYQFNKGPDVLLKALQALPKALKRETVLIALGDRGEALQQAADIPVFPLGYVAGDRLKAAIFSAADLFVFPTRAEALPLVVLESLACGTPIVGSRVGGVPDLVRPGVTGELAEVGDHQQFGRHIEELLTDSAKRERMAQECRRVAVEEYSVDRQVQAYVSMYSSLISGEFEEAA